MLTTPLPTGLTLPPPENTWDTAVAADATLTAAVKIVTTATMNLVSVVTVNANATHTLAAMIRTIRIETITAETVTGATAEVLRLAAATLLTTGGVEATLGAPLVEAALLAALVTMMVLPQLPLPMGSLVGERCFAIV